MTNLTKIKLQSDERGCWKKLQKRQQKKERQGAKYAKKLTKKKMAGKSVAAQGENTEISTRKALKICNCQQLSTAKCYENTNSEYTIEHTKHITNTY